MHGGGAEGLSGEEVNGILDTGYWMRDTGYWMRDVGQ
jgi:hypothetical protein